MGKHTCMDRNDTYNILGTNDDSVNYSSLKSINKQRLILGFLLLFHSSGSWKKKQGEVFRPAVINKYLILNFYRVNNPKNIANEIPITKTIPRITTIIFLANSIRNIMPIYAKKHHQKLIPVTKDAMAIMASLKIHLIGNLFNVAFIVLNYKINSPPYLRVIIWRWMVSINL